MAVQTHRFVATRTVRWEAALAALAVLGALVVSPGSVTALWGIAAALALVTAVVMDRRLLVPVVILILPLELWEEVSPIQFDGSGIGDRMARATVLNAGRMAIVGLAVYWVVTARGGWERPIVAAAERMLLPALALLALFVLGISWSIDREQSIIFTLALAINMTFFLLIPVLVTDRASLRLCVLALVGMMTLLALVGIYEQATNHFLWRPELGLLSERRINATFKDPNIYARILVISMVLALAGSFGLAKRWRLTALAAVYLPSLLALVFTNSRTGFLLAAGAIPLTLLLMPVSRRTRTAAIVAGAVAMPVLLVVAEVALDATFVDRLESLRNPSEAIGARRFLIDAAWAMFRDYPLHGVGPGGFQAAFQGPYQQFNLNPDANVSLSHTEVLTILAELGVIGAAIVGFLFYRFAGIVVGLFFSTSGEDRALAVGLGVSVLVIVLSSQAEARLLGEPFLWLAFGLTMALRQIIHRDGDSTAAAPDG